MPLYFGSYTLRLYNIFLFIFKKELRKYLFTKGDSAK